VTGLTGADPLWDLSRVNCLVRVFLARGAVVSTWQVLWSFARLCVGFSSLAGCVLEVVWF
jgi:hypothetical protein